MTSNHKQPLLRAAGAVDASDGDNAAIIRGGLRVLASCFAGALLLGACGCVGMPLNVRHARDAKYFPYEGATCARTGQVAIVYFERYLPEVPLVLTVWTDRQGALAINDPATRPSTPLRLTLGRQSDLDAMTNTIPKLTVGYGNDFSCWVFGYVSVVQARGETIWIPVGSLYAAKMVSALLQSFDQTDVEGDIQRAAEPTTSNTGQVFIVRVKRVELFERPLNHINMDLEFGLTWRPPGGGPPMEFSSVREVRAVSLGSVLNTSSALLDNLSRIVDGELNAAVEELMQRMCGATMTSEAK